MSGATGEPVGRPRINQQELSAPQEAALAVLVEGGSQADAARAAGVTRQAVTKWANSNPLFMERLRAARHQAGNAVDAALDRLREAYDEAVDVLERGMRGQLKPQGGSGRIRLDAAREVLKHRSVDQEVRTAMTGLIDRMIDALRSYFVDRKRDPQVLREILQVLQALDSHDADVGAYLDRLAQEHDSDREREAVARRARALYGFGSDPGGDGDEPEPEPPQGPQEPSDGGSQGEEPTDYIDVEGEVLPPPQRTLPPAPQPRALPAPPARSFRQQLKDNF